MIVPMLAKLEDRPWVDDDTIWEEKFDGIRAIVDTASHRIQSRSGKDKTAFFPEVRPRTTVPAILDGELVGETFNAIQHRTTDSMIDWRIDVYPVRYEVFDVLELDGKSLEEETLRRRKDILSTILVPERRIILTEFTHDGDALFQRAVEKGLEGVIGKSLEGVYERGRRRWIKIKCERVDHFLICGYTDGTGKREPTFGALILGKRGTNEDGIVYVGEVGTGFSEYGAEILIRKLRSLETEQCPMAWNPYTLGRPPHWVVPDESFQAVVKYLEFTNDYRLRFPAYLGLLEEILSEPS